MTEITENVRASILKVKQDLGLSNGDIGRRVDVTGAAVGRWFNGNSKSIKTGTLQAVLNLGHSNRPDPAARRNMIMEMAASIMADKVQHYINMIEQLKDQPEQKHTVDIIRCDLTRTKIALELIDEKMGCWS